MIGEEGSINSQTKVVKSQQATSGVAMIASSISVAVRFAVLIGLTLLPALGHSQCAAEANPTFRPFKGVEEKPAGHFEWDSSAGPNHDKGGGHPDNAVERHVHNLSTATTLKYSWPVGRMHNDALAQGKTDSYCYEVAWPNQNSGALNYGRGNDKTDTKVWEGSDEPKANAVLAVFSFNIITEEGPRAVSMRFLSSYKTMPQGAFAYEYLFESTNGAVVSLKWDIERDSVLLDYMKTNQLSPTLKVEGKKFIAIPAKEPPSFGFRGLRVIVGGKDVAGVEVPMFTPGKPHLAQMVD
jgi:hypothetical protein